MSQQDEPIQVTDALTLADDPLPEVTGPGAVAVDANAVHEPSSKPYHLFLDLYRGIIKGAYAIHTLHLPGMLAWIAMGFVPGLGTIFAVRDGLYCLEVKDRGGLFLNLIGLLPFMKGFSNIMDVAFVHRVHRMAHATHQVLHVTRHGRMLHAGSQGTTVALTGGAHGASAIVIAVRKDGTPFRNGAAWPAALLAFITAALSPLIMVLLLGAITGFTYFGSVFPLSLALGSGAVAVLWSLGILILAVHARRIARKMQGQSFSRGGVSLVAVWLASFGSLVCVASVAFVLYFELGSLIGH